MDKDLQSEYIEWVKVKGKAVRFCPMLKITYRVSVENKLIDSFIFLN